MKTPTLQSEFARYVSLNVLAMVALSCYILADTFFIAQALGSLGLASLNFAIAAFSTMVGFGEMAAIGGATRFAIQKNSDNPAAANKTFFVTLCFGGVVSAVFMVAGLFFAQPLAALLGANAETLQLTSTYLRATLGFAPFFVANYILIAFVKNDNNPRLAMVATLASSLGNVALDYLFMFPLGMGIFGAAFATSLSPLISLCVLSLHFTQKKSTFAPVPARPSLRKLLDLASLGFSSLVAELASAISLAAFNLVILGIAGNLGVAAYGIVANIAIVAVSIFNGIGQGTQPLASRYYGQQNSDALRRLLRYAVGTCMMFSVVLYGVIFFGCDTLIGIFNSENDAALAAIASGGMRIYFIGYLFAGFNAVAAAYLSAISRVKSASAISLLRSCVLLLPALLAFSRWLGMPGVWASFAATELCVGIVAIFALKTQKSG